jgi:hypothetical protein
MSDDTPLESLSSREDLRARVQQLLREVETLLAQETDREKRAVLVQAAQSLDAMLDSLSDLEERDRQRELEQAALDRELEELAARDRELAARYRDQAARDRDQAARYRDQAARDRELMNGKFFSPIDAVWRKVYIDIQNHDFNYSFVRGHHVVIDNNNNRYEETVQAATVQTATEITGNRNDHTNVELGEDVQVVRSNSRMNSTADSSSRPKPTDPGVDIFGVYSHAIYSAHLLPNDLVCASYWFPVVPFVLSAGQAKLSWDFMQTCIHGSLNETDHLPVVGGSDESSTPRKLPDVGIKHFPTNRIRFISQETYFDKFPCVIIVPIMTLEEVTSWRGGKYEAIVLAGDLKNDDVKILASEAYMCIHAGRGVRWDDSANCFANKDECNRACHLLEQLILCVCKEFNGAVDLHENLKGKKTNEEIERFDEWKSNFPIRTVPVPVSNDWNDDTMKVRKFSFADSNVEENPAPDPVLLLAKAASNWLKRHEIEILPGCGDDDSSTSYGEEESWSHTAKRPCTGIVEVNINLSRDDVEEPLSDDESN